MCDRCLGSGFGHAMGFDSLLGLPGLKPSGPLSALRSGLLGPRLLDSISTLSDAYRATVISGVAFDLNVEFGNGWATRHLLAQPHNSHQ